MDASSKHDIAERFMENDCQNLHKLNELFTSCENDETIKKTEKNDFLICFFWIFKGLIMLNDQRLLEILLSKAFCMHTFGALEYDPEAMTDNDFIQEDQTRSMLELDESTQRGQMTKVWNTG